MRLCAALRAAACTALLAAACHPRTPPPDLSLDPAELVAQVRAAQAPLRRVQGETRLRLEKPRVATIRQFAAAEAPDRLHLEELDFFGNPALVLVASGGRFTLYDAQKKVLYRGAATAENLSRLVPLPLDAGALVAFVLGTAPLPEGAPESVTPEGARLRLRYRQGDAVLDYFIGAHAVVEKMVRSVAGGAGPGSYQLEFSRHRKHGDAWFPDAVSLRSGPARFHVELLWTQLEVNGAADPDLFAPPAPRGAKIVDVDAPGALDALEPPEPPPGS